MTPTTLDARISVAAAFSSPSPLHLTELVQRIAVHARVHDLRTMCLVSVQWNGACGERLAEIRHLALTGLDTAPSDQWLGQHALACAPLLMHRFERLTRDWYERIAQRGAQTIPGKWLLPLLLLHPHAAKAFASRREWDSLTGIARVKLIGCANDLDELRQHLHALSQQAEECGFRPKLLLPKLLVGVVRFGSRQLEMIQLAEEMLSANDFPAFAVPLLNWTGPGLTPEFRAALEATYRETSARGGHEKS